MLHAYQNESGPVASTYGYICYLTVVELLNLRQRETYSSAKVK